MTDVPECQASAGLDPVAGQDWIALAAAARPPEGLLIDGAQRPAAAGATRELRTARDGARLGEFAWAGPEDADRAVAAARVAFERGPWPRMRPRERGETLLRLAALVQEHRAELALLVSLEMGKPIRHAYEVELRAFINAMRYYGELADKDPGEIPPTAEGELALVTREPAGVVAAVVPWNFPLTLAGWKIAPALAAGCAVVLKTSERSPLSMQRIAALALDAGVPPGVLNVLSGDGHTVGRRLGEHPDVDVLAFTGSEPVGRRFLEYSARSNLKRVYLELGGKSPNVVLPDADLDAAAQTAAWAVCFNAGQMCTAGSRLVVHEAVADQVIDRLSLAAASWRPADPLLPGTRMGPLVDRAHHDRVRDLIARGVAQGARLLLGDADRADDGGSYLGPHVLVDAGRDNVLVREEVFGPVLVVQRARDEDEAVALANDSVYGLAAAVWTAGLGAAHRVARRLKAGTVWVNCYEEGDMNVPFGGVRLSGHGRDKSRQALHEYQDIKTAWIRHG